jgi:hypothetical protein
MPAHHISLSSLKMVPQHRQDRRFFDQSATKALVHALVMSRLDYCYSLYAGLPDKTIICLQRVQNAAARLILLRSKREDATPLLKELKWLPAKTKLSPSASSLSLTRTCLSLFSSIRLNPSTILKVL